METRPVHGWYRIARVAHWRKDVFEVRLLLCFIFFPQTMLMAQVTLPIFSQTCVFLTVWEVFFFFKPWLALCEVDFCYCDISSWYFWQVCGWSFILGLQIIVIIITDGHEFKFWIVNFFFLSIFYSFCCLLLFFLFLPVFIVYHASYCKLIKLQTQKNVGLVIIQRVVRRCSIEGRQKTISNSLVSISEIKVNLWLSAFLFVHCTCICCGSN